MLSEPPEAGNHKQYNYVEIDNSPDPKTVLPGWSARTAAAGGPFTTRLPVQP
jgi:hypothetical protein